MRSFFGCSKNSSGGASSTIPPSSINKIRSATSLARVNSMDTGTYYLDVYKRQINACNRFHLRVPEDVMVMGFDNVDICTMIRPSITTVSQPKFQLGYTASEILIDLLHNSNTNARNLLLSTELIIRESATSLGNEIASPTSKTT